METNTDNRPHGSRQGAGAVIGGILGLVLGAAVFAFTNSLPLFAIFCFLGIWLGASVGQAIIPQK